MSTNPIVLKLMDIKDKRERRAWLFERQALGDPYLKKKDKKKVNKLIK